MKRDETGTAQAVGVRLRNRRVAAARCRNGDVLVRWVRLANGIPVTTEVRLTAEAAAATAEVILQLMAKETANG